MKLSIILFALLTFMQVNGVQLISLNKTKQVPLQMQVKSTQMIELPGDTGECFEDIRSRLLDHHHDLGSNNSPDNCRSYCAANGFDYAGVQFWTQCFCGNDAPPSDRLRDASECNAACPGDASQMCGQSWRMNIYTSQPTGQCYSDGGSRLLDHFEDLGSDNSPASCRHYCAANGFDYAGVQLSSQCFCGNDAPPSDRLRAASECNATCPGDASQMCGQGWRMNIYTSQLVPTGECFLDDRSRLLDHFQDFRSDNTPAICRYYCAVNGFEYAGVQASWQCFCGNDAPPSHRLRAATECDAPCPGDLSQMCGAGWRMNIYTSQLVLTGECFMDDSDRLLDHFYRRRGWNTPARCRHYCAVNGFEYAGVQSWSECYCGNDAPPSDRLRASTECNAPCPGDADQMCGHHWRMNIYTSQPTGECYLDDSSRLLDHFYELGHLNTPTRCRQICADNGFEYAGVQSWSECYCGNDAPPSDRLRAASECDGTCPGDRSQMCGHHWRMNIYTSQ